MTDDIQIRIQRAVSMPCPNCGLGNRRFYHKDEYIRAGGPDPTAFGGMWDVDGNASNDLILCLECGHIENWDEIVTKEYDEYTDWSDGGVIA